MLVQLYLFTGFAFRFEHRKWNRGRNGLHQLGQPVAPSVLFPVFKSEGEPGTFFEDQFHFKIFLKFILNGNPALVKEVWDGGNEIGVRHLCEH